MIWKGCKNLNWNNITSSYLNMSLIRRLLRCYLEQEYTLFQHYYIFLSGVFFYHFSG